MNKEEFEKLKSTVKQWLFHTGSLDPTDYANELKLKFIEPKEKEIAELKEKISVLFSCTKCPENKGGFICQKEYDNKCLTQKIQFIKELQEENAELKDVANKLFDEWCRGDDPCPHLKKRDDRLTKAKALLKEWIIYRGGTREFHSTLQDKTEDFLKES